MNNSYKEAKGFLPIIFIPQDFSLLCYFPLITSAVIFGFTSTSFVISLLLKGPIPISALPQAKGSFFTSGLLLASFPGFFTVWAFHYLNFANCKEDKTRALVFFSYIAGNLAQISLTMWAIEQMGADWFDEELVEIEENFFFGVFLISSLVFEYFSLRLTLGVKSDDVGKMSWVLGKMGIVGGLGVVSVVQICLMTWGLGYMREELEGVEMVLNYVAFYLHVLYFSTFYWDLSEIKLSVKPEDQESFYGFG